MVRTPRSHHASIAQNGSNSLGRGLDPLHIPQSDLTAPMSPPESASPHVSTDLRMAAKAILVACFAAPSSVDPAHRCMGIKKNPERVHQPPSSDSEGGLCPAAKCANIFIKVSLHGDGLATQQPNLHNNRHGVPCSIRQHRSCQVDCSSTDRRCRGWQHRSGGSCRRSVANKRVIAY